MAWPFRRKLATSAGGRYRRGNPQFDVGCRTSVAQANRIREGSFDEASRLPFSSCVCAHSGRPMPTTLRQEEWGERVRRFRGTP